MWINHLPGKLGRMKVPIIQGGMGIGISMGNLAGAVAAEGGMGVISTANIGFREPDFWQNPMEANVRALRTEIRKAREIAGGRGLIAVNTMVVTRQYEEMVRTACEEGIDAIISGAGVPLALPEHTKDFDVMIAPIVSSGKSARVLMNAWQKRHNRKPDFIVIEGCKAGGHLGFSREEAEAGTAKPLKEILAEVLQMMAAAAEQDGTSAVGRSIPVFVAGCIYDRQDLQDMLNAGAAGVQMATRFMVTEECDASEGFKNIMVQAKPEDVTILKSPVGMPGRGLATPLTETVAEGGRFKPQRCIRCIVTCNPAETPYCISRALIDAFHGDCERGLFFCGSNVGRITKQTTVHELMEELKL
ncbi:MAG: nitronate monooxygenase [Firmicutes bacterium]|nr:nitronate monooxygenase [Bacillota bacterium]